jgi:hypothetical protein
MGGARTILSSALSQQYPNALTLVRLGIELSTNLILRNAKILTAKSYKKRQFCAQFNSASAQAVLIILL